VSGGHLPSQAYAPQSPSTSSIKIAVIRVDPDGSAVVHVVDDRPFPEKDFASKLPGGPLSAARNSVILTSARKSYEEQNRYKEFDARFTREGALLIAVDDSKQKDVAIAKPALTQAELAQLRDEKVAEVNSPAYQATLAENEVAGTFIVPNVIATSCAERTPFTTGDTWRVVSKADNATYDVSVSGQGTYLGRNTVLLMAQSHYDSQAGSSSTDATVHYDPQAHLVIGMHSVVITAIQATGVVTTTTSDVTLKD
jgi:hypothetical protein